MIKYIKKKVYEYRLSEMVAGIFLFSNVKLDKGIIVIQIFVFYF